MSFAARRGSTAKRQPRKVVLQMPSEMVLRSLFLGPWISYCGLGSREREELNPIISVVHPEQARPYSS